MSNLLRVGVLAFVSLVAFGGLVAAQKGNDSADWCVVSGADCTAKETSISIQQGASASFQAALTSPDKLNDDFTGFPVTVYLAAGEWSSDCGLLTCGPNPTVSVTPNSLTFNAFAETKTFTIQSTAGAGVVPGEYKFKVKTFQPDNPTLAGIGWGLGSGIEVTVLVSEAGTCTPPTLTIVSPVSGSSLDFCASNSSQTNGNTPVSVSLSATPAITGFTAVVSRADGSNPDAVSLTEVLNTDPATATGTGHALGTIGAYKVVATATNSCNTDTKTQNFSVNYIFGWLPPTPSTPSENSQLVTKFKIVDCADAFISDETVEVTLSGGGYTESRTFGSNVNQEVTINTTDEQYHTNFDLPAGEGVNYSIVVKFQGIQQGTTRTFTTKVTGKK